MNLNKIEKMKRKGFTILTAIAICSLSSCGEQKKNAETNTSTKVVSKKENLDNLTFKDSKTEKVFKNYLLLRTALVNSDASAAQSSAVKLSGNIGEESEVLKTIAQQIAETDDLEKQRKLFSDFTIEVEPLIKENIAQGVIYKQFCPMAFNGEGGSWFSDIDQIRNPYYGDKMLKCGKITETIQ
jgi:glycine betaine/choline ABC-type transport system substrate-binding protein